MTVSICFARRAVVNSAADTRRLRILWHHQAELRTRGIPQESDE